MKLPSPVNRRIFESCSCLNKRCRNLYLRDIIKHEDDISLFDIKWAPVKMYMVNRQRGSRVYFMGVLFGRGQSSAAFQNLQITVPMRLILLASVLFTFNESILSISFFIYFKLNYCRHMSWLAQGH